MRIHKKTLIVLAIVFLVVVALVFVHSRIILLDSYAKLDEDRVYADAQRLNSAVENELAQMSAVSSDWSSWDDTYEFIVDRNEDYITSNLVDEVFLNFNLNLMVFVNSVGEVVYSKAYDLQNETEVALPDSFQQHLYPADATLLYHTDPSSSLTGILMLSEGPMLVTSNPILTSDDEGPIRGTLVWGRYLGEEVIDALAEQTLLSLDVITFADGGSLPNFPKAQQPLLEDVIFVSPLSNDSIAGYSLIRDIYGEPALILKVDEPRIIYQRGLTTVNYLVIFIVAISLLFSALIYLLMDKLILSRLTRLRAMVSNIGKKKGLPEHLSLPGNDELSDLASAMNTTFGELASYHQALTDSEQKYSTLVEKSTDGIIVIQDGLLRFANQKTIEMTGFSTEDALGKPFLNFVSPEYKGLVADNYRRRMAGEEVLSTYESRILCKDGGDRLFEVNANIIQYEGKPANMVILRDITERKQMQEKLVITDRLASVGELASGIAHELNNPLTGIIGLSQLVLDRDIPSDVRDDLNMVCSEAQRAAQIVQNLLTFARKHPSEKQMLNINTVIEQVLELRAYDQGVNNIRVDTHLAVDLPEVMADSFQLQQVFLNIVINAEFFMKEAHNGGTLTITTEKAGNNVRAVFVDDGPGITEESLGHIFDPFYTTKQVGKGTGLGLSICHGMVVEHGGRIYAESKPGEGATFVVELPIDENRAEDRKNGKRKSRR